MGYQNRSSSGRDSGPKAPTPTGETITILPRQGSRDRPDSELRVSLDSFNGHAFIDLRVWETNRNGDSWPVKGKGVTIRLGEGENVALALANAVQLSADPEAIRKIEDRNSEIRRNVAPSGSDAYPSRQPASHSDRNSAPWDGQPSPGYEHPDANRRGK